MKHEEENPNDKEVQETGAGDGPAARSKADSSPGLFYLPDREMGTRPYVQFVKGKESRELLRTDKNAFMLLIQIAQRAKRKVTDELYKDLGVGECYVGDHEECCLSRQEYRTALKKLKKWQFLTIKSTNKGTIVKLINSDIFDINVETPNHQINQTATSKQPASNQQATTTKKDKKDKKEKNKEYIVEIVAYLNEKTGKRFSPNSDKTISLIDSRIKEGFTPQDFFTVIDNKTSKWLNDSRMNSFLRPITLFGTKFEAYLNENTHPLQGVVSEKTMKSIDSLKRWEAKELEREAGHEE